MFTDDCSPAESATRALQMQPNGEDKLQAQNNLEKISADSAIQREDEKQKTAGQLLTSDKSESQPTTLNETETLPEAETLPDTDDIGAGV